MAQRCKECLRERAAQVRDSSVCFSNHVTFSHRSMHPGILTFSHQRFGSFVSVVKQQQQHQQWNLRCRDLSVFAIAWQISHPISCSKVVQMMLVMGMFWNHNNFPPPMREGGGEVSGDAHVAWVTSGPAQRRSAGCTLTVRSWRCEVTGNVESSYHRTQFRHRRVVTGARAYGYLLTN